jgi:hypothetical protein
VAFLALSVDDETGDDFFAVGAGWTVFVGAGSSLGGGSSGVSAGWTGASFGAFFSFFGMVVTVRLDYLLPTRRRRS